MFGVLCNSLLGYLQFEKNWIHNFITWASINTFSEFKWKQIQTVNTSQSCNLGFQKLAMDFYHMLQLYGVFFWHNKLNLGNFSIFFYPSHKSKVTHSPFLLTNTLSLQFLTSIIMTSQHNMLWSQKTQTNTTMCV